MTSETIDNNIPADSQNESQNESRSESQSPDISGAEAAAADASGAGAPADAPSGDASTTPAPTAPGAPGAEKPWSAKPYAIGIAVVAVLLVALTVFALVWQRPPARPEILYLKAEATYLRGQDFVTINFKVDEALCKEKYGEQWQGCYDRRDQILPPETFPALAPAVEGEWRYTDRPMLVYRHKDMFPAGTNFTVSLPDKLLGEKVVIEPRVFTFASAPLKVNNRSISVQIDRADPRRAYVNASVTFNSWLGRDATAFIVLEGEPDSGLKLEDIQYRWQNDWTLNISARVADLPEKDGYVFLRIRPGLSTKDGSDTLKTQVESRATVRSRLNILQMESMDASVVSKDLLREQTLFVGFNLEMDPARLGGDVRAWILPKYKKAEDTTGEQYYWDMSDLTDDVLARSTPVSLAPAPVGEGMSPVLAWSFKAEPGRQMLVEVPKGIAAPGNFPLSAGQKRILSVPDFEKELYIMQSGNILALGGEKRLSVFSRGFDAMLWEVQRVRPEYINHLVTQNRGTFDRPRLGMDGGDYDHYEDAYYDDDDDYGGYRAPTVGTFDYYDLSDVYRGSVALEPGDGSEPRFTSLDLGAHMGPGKPGIFHVRLTGSNGDERRDMSDTFILVTDLGVMLKLGRNHERDVFVVSLSTGRPVGNARVDVLGRNGLPVYSLHTGPTGHARLPSLEGLYHEREPVALVIASGMDSTFMPLNAPVGQMNLSRFPTGGRDYRGEDIASFVFSERGIYRPGETLRFGAVTKRADWKAGEIEGMPLRFEITDPGANSVFRQTRNTPFDGLESIELPLTPEAQAGQYRLSVSIASGPNEGTVLGAATVQVEEFKPDTLKILASLSERPVRGWLKPEEAAGLVSLDNLYGMPAAEHRVSAKILVRPPEYSFAEYKDYTFRDPAVTLPDSIQHRVYELGEKETDQQGRARFDLGLDRFAGSGFGVSLEVEGFEPGGGRSVTGLAFARVSPRDWLTGWKTDSSSSWLRKDQVSTINFIAVDRQLERVDAGELIFTVNAIDYVATLVRTDRGFKYDPSRREREVKRDALQLGPDGLDYTLPTSAPGEYELVLTDASGEQICVYPFVVAGAGVAAFGRERDATLRLHINKRDYEAGEDMEVYLSAPYGGAGLITLEGDGVVAHTWFKTDQTDSVHRIRVPQGFEGRGFVSVSLVRGLDSKEIYMSPHTYAVAPFYAGIPARDLGVALTAPERVRPGEELTIGVSAKRAGRAIVFAVDEGILQLTSYRTPDPLAYFMRGQGLGVRTNQTFDLLMPEYSLVRETLSAFGGDYESMMFAEDAGQSMLNPFRRQAEKSVVYWSGVVEVGPQARDVGFVVPSYFNGRLRLMAVAVAADGVSSLSRSAIARGDVIISPDLPVAAAPGDEFEVTIAVTNNIEGSGVEHPFSLQLDPGERLALVPGGAGEAGEAGAAGASGSSGEVGAADSSGGDSSGPLALSIDEGRQARAVVRLKALDTLGEGVLGIVAASTVSGESASRPATISVRPATPRMSAFETGRISGNDFSYTIKRDLYPEYGRITASVSALPVPVMDALSDFLLNYPYGCTEQILSAAFPYVLLHKDPDLLPLPVGKSPAEARKDAEAAVARGVLALQERQVRAGQFSLWPYEKVTYDFLTVYGADFLSSAREAGFSVPRALEDATMDRLRGYIDHEPASLHEARQMAYAAWVLTRNGRLTSNSIAGLVRWLDGKYAKSWKSDITAVYIAACNVMMKQQKEADALVGAFTAEKSGFWADSWFSSPLSVNAQYLTIIARHFPERLEDKAVIAALDAVVDGVMKNHYSSVSAAHAVRALAAYAENAVAGRTDFEIVALDAEGKEMESIARGTSVRRMELLGAHALRVKNAKNLYWQVSSNGFDRVPPASADFAGLELKIEYLDAATGKPVQTVKQGDEVLVALRARCNRGGISNVALVAPLPGGFEQVISRAGQVQSPDGRAPGGDGEDHDDDGYGDTGDERRALPDGESATDRAAMTAIASMARDLGITTRPMRVVSTDRREDRMIVYTSLDKEETLFLYRIKAVNRGAFTLPPVYAEALYERTLRAHTAAGKLIVE